MDSLKDKYMDSLLTQIRDLEDALELANDNHAEALIEVIKKEGVIEYLQDLNDALSEESWL
jgi:lauroyl/myristoyl acyltransferase